MLSQIYKGIYTLSEEQPNVAVLFCDIYEFDKIVATESTNIVKILDNLYRVFDQICFENSNQKIEVIFLQKLKLTLYNK